MQYRWTEESWLAGRLDGRYVASEGIMMLEGRNWVGMGRGDELWLAGSGGKGSNPYGTGHTG